MELESGLLLVLLIVTVVRTTALYISESREVHGSWGEIAMAVVLAIPVGVLIDVLLATSELGHNADRGVPETAILRLSGRVSVPLSVAVGYVPWLLVARRVALGLRAFSAWSLLVIRCDDR